MSKIKKMDTLGINGKSNDNKTIMNSYLLRQKGDQNVQWLEVMQWAGFLILERERERTPYL